MRSGSLPGLAVISSLVVLAPACTRQSPPSPETPGPDAPSGPTGTPAAASPAVPPAFPPPPAVLPVSSVEVRLGETSSPLASDGSSLVDPGATFDVRLPFAARGARLVLLDARDTLVPSNSDAEVGGSTSRFTLVPMEPLTPASRYVLRLEGLESRMVGSGDGLAFEPLALSFLVAGEPPPAPPKKARKKRLR